jgi:hypothetical protein
MKTSPTFEDLSKYQKLPESDDLPKGPDEGALPGGCGQERNEVLVDEVSLGKGAVIPPPGDSSMPDA